MAFSGPKTYLRRSAVLVSLLVFVACAPVIKNHGYAPKESELDEVIVAVDTRDSVLELLGSPTVGGEDVGSDLYYVASRWRHSGMLKPRAIERRLVAITIDENDVVANVETFALEDGQVVVLNRRVTGGGAQGISFIQQLLGNAGRIDAGTLVGQP